MHRCWVHLVQVGRGQRAVTALAGSRKVMDTRWDNGPLMVLRVQVQAQANPSSALWVYHPTWCNDG